MAAFQNTPEDWQRLDWTILRSGWGRIYSKPEFLLIDIAWLRQHRYRVLEFDCSGWQDEQDMLTALQRRFRGDDKQAATVEGLKRLLSEHSVLGGGLAVVLHHFDTLGGQTRQTLLEILAESARFHLLLGERVVTLVQVDNPAAEFKPVGAACLTWNPQETKFL